MECFYRFVSQNKQLFFRYSVPISWSVKLGHRLFWTTNWIVMCCLLERHFFGAFVYSWKGLLVCHVRSPVCPLVSARLPLGEFPYDFIMRTSMKICREKTNFVEIGQDMADFTWRSKYVILYQAVRIAEGIKNITVKRRSIRLYVRTLPVLFKGLRLQHIRFYMTVATEINEAKWDVLWCRYGPGSRHGAGGTVRQGGGGL
jgi:hypothetical protein